MEKHHRLRRDPSWSPHGCNLCGQEGHLAATCPNGTVKWKTYFPPEEFLTFDAASLRRPEPDYAALEKAAREYAAMMATRAPTTGLGGPNHPLG